MKSRFSAVSMIALLALSASAQAANTRGTFSSNGTVPFLNAGTSSDGLTNSTALGFQVNGTEYMRLTATGSLGIATATPTAPFSVGNLFTVSSTGAVSAGTWNGSMIGTGYLGTGSATTSTFLRGDGTWAAPSGAGWVNLSTTVLNSSSVTASTWYTLDLSSYVGANQTLVLLQVTPVAETHITLRPTGDSLIVGDPGVATDFGAGPSACYMKAGATCYLLVQTNSSGKIDYQSFYTTTITATLRGFIAPSSSYAPNLWSLNGSNVYYNSGNVGIGTATPSNLLTIQAASTASPSEVLISNGTYSGNLLAAAGQYGLWMGGAAYFNGTSWIANSTAGAIAGAVTGGFIVNTFTGATVGSATTMQNSFQVSSTGSVGVGTSSPSVALDLGSKTDAVLLPVGTSAQRPTASVGMMRYNSSTGAFEGYKAGAWSGLGGSSSLGLSATAAAPARSDDATTGLFSTATGTVSTSIVGTEKLRVTATGVNLTGGTLGYGINGNNVVAMPAGDTTSIAVGINALTSQTGTDGQNVALGTGALSANTTGSYNTAIGYSALNLNTTWSANVAIGAYALSKNTSGSHNTAVGYLALSQSGTGDNNVGVGSITLYSNTTGYSNTGLGNGSLYKNTTGNNNIGIGDSALYGNTGGQHNIGIGSSSLSGNITGFANMGIGSSTLYKNSTGSYNIALGYKVASTTLASGSNNILIGTSSAVDTPTAATSNWLNIGNTIYGDLSAGNVGIGTATARSTLDLGGRSDSLIVPTGTTGQRPATGIAGMIRYNTTSGAFEGYQGSTPAWSALGGSSALGASATAAAPARADDVTTGLFSITASTVSVATNGTERFSVSATGVNLTDVALGYGINGKKVVSLPGGDTTSVAVGVGALSAQTATQMRNVAIGYNALAATTTGYGQNTGVGDEALRSVTSGVYNVGIGYQSGYSLKSGYNNIAIGQQAAYANTSGSNLIAIGQQAGAHATGSFIAIGQNALYYDTSNGNIAIGDSSMSASGNGGQNVGLGIQTLRYVGSGTLNVAVGHNALGKTKNSSHNVGIGYNALANTATYTTGSYNTVIGDAVASTTLVSGSNNILIGTSSAVDTPASATSNFLNIGNLIYGDTSTGYVGIKTNTPSYNLHVNGSVAGTSAYNNLSDARMKKDVEPLIYGLETVMQMRPVGFNWINQDQDWKKQHQIGLIAQEVERLIPEVVTTANDEIKTKSIAYGSLVPVLIKAVQDLQEENKALKAQIKEQDAVYNARFKAIEDQLKK